MDVIRVVSDCSINAWVYDIETYELEIEAESHAMWIRDLILNPETTVQSGRALLATVRVSATVYLQEKFALSDG